MIENMGERSDFIRVIRTRSLYVVYSLNEVLLLINLLGYRHQNFFFNFGVDNFEFLLFVSFFGYRRMFQKRLIYNSVSNFFSFDGFYYNS